jgi:hypothetical protein
MLSGSAYPEVLCFKAPSAPETHHSAESAGRICRRACDATPWRLSPWGRIATAAEATSWQIGGLSTSGGNEHPKVVRSTQQGGEDPDGTKWQPLAVARLEQLSIPVDQVL